MEEQIRKIDKKAAESLNEIDEGNIPVGLVGYNKISVDASNFHIEIISCEDDMDRIEQRVSFILLLCIDDAYRNKWKEQSSKLLDKWIEDTKKHLIKSNEDVEVV